MSQHSSASFAGPPPALVAQQASPPNAKSTTKRVGIYAAAFFVLAAIVASVVVLVEMKVLGGSSNSDIENTGVDGTNAPTATLYPTATFYPTGVPTFTPTSAPSTVPTMAPSSAPTESPTATPTRAAECTILWGDMQDEPEPFSYAYRKRLDSGSVVAAVWDNTYFISPTSENSTLLDFKPANGNTYGVGSVTGRLTVNVDMTTDMLVTVNDPRFYINRMGGLSSSHRIKAGVIDPLGTNERRYNAFTAPGDSMPTNVTAQFESVTIVWDKFGNAHDCVSPKNPSKLCAGPWFTYTYVEVCPVDFFATQVPTQATAPTPLATAPPSSPAPLINLVFDLVDPDQYMGPAVHQAFDNAVDFWNGVITNTHTAIELDVTSAEQLGCGENTDFPVDTTHLHGLTIFVSRTEIDDVGGVLARAGPCAYSYTGATSQAFGDVLPRIGVMAFDNKDLTPMVNNGTLERVIMHEIAHVLGLGTLWDHLRSNSVADNTLNGDPRYIGSNGVAGYKQLGGQSESIPVANLVEKAGVSDTHWRERTFEDEIMTGVKSGAMPVSIMTIKALQDLGYVVDETKAETYSMPDGRSSQRSEEFAPMMEDDIIEFDQEMDASRLFGDEF